LSRTSAIERLTAGIRRVPDAPAPQRVLPDVDEAAFAQGLDLEGRGTERGARGEPAAGSAPDHVEGEIRERIEGARRRADDACAAEARTYDERIAALDFEGRFAVIGQAAPAAVGEFASEAAQGRDELHALRRALRDAEGERDAFRKRHGIHRPARRSGGGARILKIGLVGALLVAEIALNGTFLSRGNEMGLAGGAVEATAFAALNVGVAFLAGLHAARLTVHRNWGLKAVGAAAVLGTLALALLLNLALAHYRESMGPEVADAGRAVIQRLRDAPLGLEDLKSWLLFGIGLLFAAVAFGDGVALDDPYPGYGAVEARLARAHEAYIDRKAALMERLADIRDEAMDALNEAGRDLAVRRSEHDAILDARSRLARHHAGHVDALEAVGQRLSTRYREANARARKAPAPPWFAEPFRLARTEPVQGVGEGTAREDLRAAIAGAQGILDSNVAAVHQAYDAAARGYRQIDDIVPEEPTHAQAQPIAA
jgi:hypothetical protein